MEIAEDKRRGIRRSDENQAMQNIHGHVCVHIHTHTDTHTEHPMLILQKNWMG